MAKLVLFDPKLLFAESEGVMFARSCALTTLAWLSCFWLNTLIEIGTSCSRSSMRRAVTRIPPSGSLAAPAASCAAAGIASTKLSAVPTASPVRFNSLVILSSLQFSFLSCDRRRAGFHVS